MINLLRHSHWSDAVAAIGGRKMNKVDRSGDLEKQKAEDEARTAELERARLEHERREQAIRDQRRNRENEDQGKG